MTTTTNGTASDGGGAAGTCGAGDATPTARSPPNLSVNLPASCAGLDRPDGFLAEPRHQAPLLMDVAIRCTVPSCPCECFSPCKSQIRMCDGCGHGWVSHALDKLGFRHLFHHAHQVELVQPSIAFDVASLVLYGTQAVPVRLKILLDRLLSVLRREEAMHVLHGFGWTCEDYARGYILQDPSGRVLDRWLLATREEEPLILQQFLRFGETKSIAQQLLLQDTSDRNDLILSSPKTESDIKKFIERTNRITSVKPTKVHVTHPSSLSATVKSVFKQPSSVSSTHSASPTALSPGNSPVSLSPLNRLQNMQPYDYRKTSPEPRTTYENPTVSSSLNRSSPISSPATSFPSAVSVSSLNHTSRYTTASSDLSGTDEVICSDDDDNTNSAINLTRSNSSTTSYLDSIFAAKKVRHLRKSANPMKRRWNPMVLATLSTNPATGKKRVQCHVCLKTFCDKGALKIHFSAVHLREMHKCTVEGCNMMFSSRRSRNRHSANPNPKLHTPNYRRKINPHDGRAAIPYPIIPSTGISSFNSTLLAGSVSNHLDGESSTASENENSNLNKCLDVSLSHKDINQSIDSHNQPIFDDEISPLPLTKKSRIDISSTQHITNGGDEGIDLSMKDDNFSSTKGVRKRKSLNPTKCQVNSDDDLQYVSTDDSSSDTYIDQDNDDNGRLDSKSSCISSDGLDSKDEDDDDLESESYQRIKLKNFTIKTPENSSPPPTSVPFPVSSSSSLKVEQAIINPKVIVPETKPLNENHNGRVLIADSNSFKSEVIKNRTHETEDICENPLRHLETLSLGAFNNMVNPNRNVNHSTHNSSGVSYHAPGLGLGSSSTAVNRSISPQNEKIAHVVNHSSSIIPPMAHQLSSGSLNSDPENSLSDQQMPLLPVYRDASIVGSVEIPVDKENPRRCTACGKIFQNHFGVKTHYQNVHLKLMHKCTVEGCNAAFPSKRSRDRHSANLNLHRKLLSTSSEKPAGYFDKSALYPFHSDIALRGELFSRFYDPQALPLSFADLYHSRLSAENGFLTGSQYPSPLTAIPGFHPAFMVPATSGVTANSMSLPVKEGSGRDSPPSSISSAPLSPHTHTPNSPQRRSSSVKLEEDLKPDVEGRFHCKVCDKKFHESVVLREHYEKCHAHVLLHCLEDGCNKIFLSGRTRALHNDELHQKTATSCS